MQIAQGWKFVVAFRVVPIWLRWPGKFL